jgi:predicted enzyme related to lactoylglutathione lyase
VNKIKVNQILSRFYVQDMNHTIAFYEKVLNDKCKSRFQYPQLNLELAQLGTILIICGSDEALKPFVDTQATFSVDSILEFKEFLLAHSTTIIRDISKVPTGLNMTIKHPDGNIIEYVELL